MAEEIENLRLFLENNLNIDQLKFGIIEARLP
jgi:hypothetical protein